MTRVCVIHAGTHKTGTTSLQYFLQTNLDVLARSGLHFPRSGWYGVVPGQHAVAWELLKEEPGEQLRALRDELAAVQGHAVLSSEEFSLFHDHPDRFAPLLAMLRDLGFTPRILLYVRAQAEFAESIYVEQIKHGSARRLPDVLHEIWQDGTYRLDLRTIPFRYEQIVERFEAMLGPGSVLVRPYARAGDTFAIFRDFLAALQLLAPGFVPPRDGLELAHPRINESLTFGALLAYAFVHLHPEIGLPDDPTPFFSEHAADVPPAWLNERYALLSRDECLRFVRVFDDENRRLEARYGIAIPGARTGEIAPDDAPLWERAQLERAVYDRLFDV